MTKKEILLLLGIALIFVLLHIPGVHLPYHQDEYKWPIIVNPALTDPGGIPHPPVGEFIYRQAGFLVGYDNFRLVPFFFGFLNLFLLFYLVKNLYDTKTALWSVGLFTISFYSLLASLMVDTDGAIMPFFFLVSLISYYKLRENDFDIRNNKAWLLTFVGAVVLGFLVKVSFAVGIAAIFLDFLIEKGAFSDIRRLLKYSLFGFGALIFLGLILFIATFVFPFFDLSWSLKYWEHFAKFGGRGWLQTFIQFMKGILYTSPLLVLPVAFVDREKFNKLRPFFLFILIGLFFYLVAFDFSVGALDRYLQFLVVPLCVISGSVFAGYFANSELKINLEDKIVASIIAVGVFLLQFFNHFVPALYPKTEWVSRVVSLKWNFLFPFTGGSGPTGFYVSFLFMALLWFCSLVFTISAFFIKRAKKRALFCILILGIVYNGVFIEEHLFGKINGSPYKLFESARSYIEKDENIKKVVVYNDIGGYEIQKLGKYERRMYATPQFVPTYEEFFTDFSGHVLFIDIPKIGEHNFYTNYLNTCKSVFEEKDRYITAQIFECNKK